jgi:hypothetical protein
MTTLKASRSLAFLAFAVSIAATDAPAPAELKEAPPASRPASALDAMIGVWKCVKTDPPEKKESDQDLKLLFRSDKTYVQRHALFRSRGTWQLKENVLTLQGDEPSGVKDATTITFDGKQLVLRPWPGRVEFYERQGPVPVVVEPTQLHTIEQLRSEVKRDPAAAKKKYENLKVEIVGVVANVGVRFILVGTPPADDPEGMPVGWISCESAELEPWRLVARGQKVKVRGELLATEYGLEIYDASFTLDGPPAFVVTTAEALARECGKDREEAKKKYTLPKDNGLRSVILTGELLESGAKDRNVSLYLGTADAKVQCDFEATKSTVNALSSLKPGARIKLQGVVDTSFKQPVVRMMLCRLITK